MALACGHDAPAYGLPVCEHIRTATNEVDFSIHYTGQGHEQQRICVLCREEAEHGRPVAAGRICEDCSDTSYGSVVDSVGRPEIIDASRPVPGAGPLVPFPAETGTVLDLAPTERGLLLLAADGRILLWDAEAGSCTHLATTGVTVPADAKPWSGHDKALRLHASRNGRFAAVVVDFGRTGEVIDLTTGTVTTALENDGYHSETVPYSLLFTEHAGRDVVLHRTRWNRIAGTDPATGEPVLLMPESEKEAAWAHSFHGALHLSPGATRLASDTWVWHPLGQPVTWDLARWFAEGKSAWNGEQPAVEFRLLPPCEYHWNRPMVWLDEARIVLGGLGDDDEAVVPGARVFDVTRMVDLGVDGSRPDETATFGGPEGRFFAADGLLYSAGGTGLEIWDPTSGARIGSVPDFHPTHHDTVRRELVQLTADGVRRRPTGESLPTG
ncbi:hypothetical protein ACFV0H_09870 [Streptomyces erythrochromogenes]|uniref:hypothetical protein n=1 Tax=Streptomyces erythrochromogenes TaxID=285574 RepID=UPI0036931624